MGRGNSGKGKGSGGNVQAANNAPALDGELVRRANAAGTIVDFGDSTARQYDANVKEIRGMDMSNAEKEKAIKDLHGLTEKQLEAEAKSRSPYSMGEGPARVNTGKMRKNADKAVEARQNTRNFMDKLRDEQKKKKQAKGRADMATAMKQALSDGALSFTVDGVTYTRPSKRSKTFTRQR